MHIGEKFMIKKLTKNKDSFTLEIEKSIADAVGITDKTAIEMIAIDDMLIIKPKNKKTRTAEKQKIKLTNSLMDKYESILKKLAKT